MAVDGTVELHEFEKSFWHYIRRVKKGCRFLIVKNGEPMAIMEPITPSTQSFHAASD